MTDYRRRYSIPTDAITKRTFDKEVDRQVVARETEQRKRQALADKVRTLQAQVASLEVRISQLAEAEIKRQGPQGPPPDL